MARSQGQQVTEPLLLLQYRRATAKEARLREQANKAADDRARNLAAMHVVGMSYGQIAEETDLSRSRVQQLVERGLELGNRMIEDLEAELKRHKQ